MSIFQTLVYNHIDQNMFSVFGQNDYGVWKSKRGFILVSDTKFRVCTNDLKYAAEQIKNNTSKLSYLL